ncbi:MAG: DUF1810 domain-containing protein [Oscillospiraceae bacterium]|nr:DUF1810 domain-containing protein [Oscillospiraceae bacterium]
MYDVSRFTEAQKRAYPTALAEIRRGRKMSHWMWYIFPQVAGLGFSSTAQYYAISGLEEARAFLADETLRNNLVEISSALLQLPGDDAEAVMGWPDCLKLRSSMTLFKYAAPDEPVFQQVLDKYYRGEDDFRTMDLLDL